MDKLLQILNSDARLSNAVIATMLGETEAEVAARIAAYEAKGLIRGYRPLFDYDKLEEPYVESIIELKVTPKRDLGFEEVAKKVASFPGVQDVYLMSGGYDLLVRITGKDFKDIALFVAQRLAVLDGVVSTATHFILSRYKQDGIMLVDDGTDERGNISL